MAYYYITEKAQHTGEHEVHTSECRYLQNPKNKKALGVFYSCSEAIASAKKTYAKVDCCCYCARNNHPIWNLSDIEIRN